MNIMARSREAGASTTGAPAPGRGFGQAQPAVMAGGVLKPALFLAGLCVLIRLSVWFVYRPIIFDDTSTYDLMARQIFNLDFSQYLGQRTPVYPLFLLLSGLNPYVTWLYQSLLGVGVSLLLFHIAWRTTGHIRLAFLAGLSYSLCINQVFFEAGLLTESLSTFLLVLALDVFVLADESRSRRLILHGCLGVVISLAALTRPLLLFLFPLYLFFLLLMGVGRRLETGLLLRGILAFLLPVVFLVGGWSLFNKSTTGYLGPTTLVGYNLTQHSGAFMELAPDRYADVRDVYLQFRAKRIAEAGTHSMTIWRATPAMLASTGLSYGELSRRLRDVSVYLFLHHPIRYGENVYTAWRRFWVVENYWQLDKLRVQALRSPLERAWKVERRLLVAVNWAYLVLGLVSLLAPRLRISMTRIEWLLLATVLSGSVLQAMTEFGENSRYAIPFQVLVLFGLILRVRPVLAVAAGKN